MRCDFIPNGDPDANGLQAYRCSRCDNRTGPQPNGPDRIFAICRVPGWGDYASHWLTILTGITKADLSRWLGKDCGCKERQEKLNTWGERLRQWWLGQ
jgi:hypothetical protein